MKQNMSGCWRIS